MPMDGINLTNGAARRGVESAQPNYSRYPIEPRIEAEDSADVATLHDGDVHCVARGKGGC